MFLKSKSDPDDEFIINLIQNIILKIQYLRS